MAANKIIFGGQTLIDLTGDSITPDKLLKGETAHDKSGEQIEGECTFDVDSNDATATQAEILAGKTGYARGTKLTGTMPNNESVELAISSKDQQVTVPLGFHDGSGKAVIAATEKAKLIPDNIREGIEILGVTGQMSGTEGVTAQIKNVSPSKDKQVVTPDEGYNYLSEVIVEGIPYTETLNSAGGNTVTIG